MSVTLPPVPGTVRVTLHHAAITGEKWTNQFHLGVTGEVGPVGALALAEWVGAAYNSAMNDKLWQGVGLSMCTVRDLSSADGAEGTSVHFGLGSNGGTPMPLGACMVVSEKTGAHYRGGHSRLYISGLVQGAIVKDGITPASITGLQSGISTFKSNVENFDNEGISGVGWVAVRYHQGHTYTTGANGRQKVVPTLAAGGPRVDGVTSLIVHTLLGSQRRRNHFK